MCNSANDEEDEHVAHDVWTHFAHRDDTFLGYDCVPLLKAMDTCMYVGVCVRGCVCVTVVV